MTGQTSFILRIRTKKGISRIHSLTDGNSFGDLKKLIADLIGVDFDLIKILRGYPPKSIECQTDSATLASLHLKTGDLLTVEENEYTKHHTGNQGKHTNGSKCSVLLRKVVPADNSCLFTSVNYVINDAVYDSNCQKSMRELIANTVKSDPLTYTEAFLGKKNKEYCEWIQNTSTWGGAIEISILSKYYKTEICVVDIQTGRIDRFGEDCEYDCRVFILYDGIHFDPLYLETTDEPNKQQTKFTTRNQTIMQQAIELGNEFRKARQFTDTSSFKLKCLVCQKGLTGQKEAQEHAKSSGHINFGEF